MRVAFAFLSLLPVFVTLGCRSIGRPLTDADRALLRQVPVVLIRQESGGTPYLSSGLALSATEILLTPHQLDLDDSSIEVEHIKTSYRIRRSALGDSVVEGWILIELADPIEAGGSIPSLDFETTIPPGSPCYIVGYPQPGIWLETEKQLIRAEVAQHATRNSDFHRQFLPIVTATDASELGGSSGAPVVWRPSARDDFCVIGLLVGSVTAGRRLVTMVWRPEELGP